MCYTSKSVLKCSAGDILAADVYSTNGKSLVLAKEAVLNEYMMERLLEMGINTVRIYKGEEECSAEHMEFQQKYRSIASLTRNIFQDMVSGRTMDYDRLSYIAEQILGSVQEDCSIINCICEVRKKDEYTYYHSINVAFYSMLIAKWLKLSRDDIKKAVLSGLLHDIGKIKIPDAILNKKGRLTKEEFEIVKSHPVHGYEIADGIELLDRDIKNAILHHHERMDGSGYPFRYSAKNINLYSRIVAVADVFDAMTSERIYKGKNTPFEVFHMFLAEGAVMFDIRILNVFMKNMANYLTGSRVQLSSGETGDIVYIPYQCLIFPIVKAADRYIDLSQDSDIKIIKML
jgi:putative nucleotidyltransferase with HDIG domain